MEVLQVPQPRHAAERVRADRGRAVRGQVDLLCLGQPADLQQPGDATAPGHVGLQAVHRPEPRGEVGHQEPVLASRDVEPGRPRPATVEASLDDTSAAADTSP